MLRAVFCCCGPTTTDDSAVRPDERTHLIPKDVGLSSGDADVPTPVDHQILQDRMNDIVRAKQGKMVNVAARSPFTVHSALPPAELEADKTLSPSESDAAPPPRRPAVQVLTMTPAPSRGSLSLIPSRFSSPTASRSSSRRRPAESTGIDSGNRSERERRGRFNAQQMREPGVAAASSVVPQPPPSAKDIDIPLKPPPVSSEDDIAFSWSDT